jgi:hypothetical protein
VTDPNAWMRTPPRERIDLRTDMPHSARVYDVLLGGKTNYQADRDAARKVIENLPIARLTAVENRSFMYRAARHLVEEAGIRQFLDIGTGIPTSPNLHEIVQDVDPAARIVYADNDPIVLAHSRALHSGTPEGRTAYIHGDLCDPTSILEHPDLADTLDPTEPIAIMLLTVLHWLAAEADAYAIVRQLLDAVPSGSYLVISHVTSDLDAPFSIKAVADDLKAKGSNVTPRTKPEVAEFFTGLDLVDPGLQLIQQWRPAPAQNLAPIHCADENQVVPLYVAIARKP